MLQCRDFIKVEILITLNKSFLFRQHHPEAGKEKRIGWTLSAISNKFRSRPLSKILNSQYIWLFFQRKPETLRKVKELGIFALNLWMWYLWKKGYLFQIRVYIHFLCSSRMKYWVNSSEAVSPIVSEYPSSGDWRLAELQFLLDILS